MKPLERLTYNFTVGGQPCWQVHGTGNLTCGEVCKNQEESGCEKCPICEAIDRLAAYEDTGLTPEEIIGLCAMDKRARMAELLRQEENRPLTMEEMREMGREPYWHVSLQKDSSPPHWAILNPHFAKHIEDYGYGETWLAFRRKPEESASC